MDFAVSSDSQSPTDNRRARGFAGGARPVAVGAASAGVFGGAAGGIDEAARRLLREGVDLDIAGKSLCWSSMNIGIMLFPPSRRGAMIAIDQATSHLSEDNNLRRVDQGPINYRWKTGARAR